jgi:hypothetical protein
MEKLLLIPERDRYSTTAGPATVMVPTAGGRSRTRRDQLGAPTTVSVQWVCSYGEYAYLGAFYRELINHGSDAFLIDLPVWSSVPAEQTANFKPGGPQLDGVSGLAYAVSATLEVKTPNRSAFTDYDRVTAKEPNLDGLPVMGLIPSASGYGVQRGATVIQTQPGMGPSAFRLAQRNTPSLLNVSWNVGPADFDYLCAFYFTATAEGSLPFIMPAIHDYPDPQLFRALIVPGSFGLGGIKGLTYSVSAQVEVVPVVDAALDEMLLWLYATYGEEWPEIFGDLAHLVNVTMPGVMDG